MKKTTLILLMLLLIVFAVCADGWRSRTVSIIRLKTAVHSQVSISSANDNAISSMGKPLYVLELKIDGEEQDSSQEVDFFLAENDVSSDNVSVEFLVTQSAMTKTNESIKLLITAGQLSFVDSDNFKYSTSKVTLSYKEVNPENVIVSAENDADRGIMTVTVEYLGINKAVEAGTDLFVFTAEWESDEELKAHPGTYTGEVSMTYLTE